MFATRSLMPRKRSKLLGDETGSHTLLSRGWGKRDKHNIILSVMEGWG